MNKSKIIVFEVIFFMSVFSITSFAQNCPSQGTIRKANESGTSINLLISPYSRDTEINIFDSNEGVYIYSESKLDPGFYIQKDLAVLRNGDEINITGFEKPYSKKLYKIVVLKKNCKIVELAIRD